jgi:hypothetical protein
MSAFCSSSEQALPVTDGRRPRISLRLATKKNPKRRPLGVPSLLPQPRAIWLGGFPVGDGEPPARPFHLTAI